MSENKEFVIRCRAIILHEGKLLVVRHTHDMSYTALPGGHLEWGEDVKECLSREIIEELGIKPEIGRLLYINTFTDENTQPIEFFFEVLNGTNYLNIKNLTGTHSHELSEVVWINPTDDTRILPQKLNEDFKEGNLLSDDVRYIK